MHQATITYFLEILHHKLHVYFWLWIMIIMVDCLCKSGGLGLVSIVATVAYRPIVAERPVP